jgi:hypothetical protein
MDKVKGEKGKEKKKRENKIRKIKMGGGAGRLAVEIIRE